MALKRFFNKTEHPVKNACLLKSSDPKYSDIQLKETAMAIGRSVNTAIEDVRCSRKQVLIKPDYVNHLLLVKTCGLNPCGINGFMSRRGKVYEMFNNDVLELVYGSYPYKVVFDSPVSEAKRVKREPNLNESVQDIKEEELKDDPDSDDYWRFVNGELLVYNPPNIRASEKIAAYDMDGTLIKPKSGNVFPKDVFDWELFCSTVPFKLKGFYNQGYKIVIFTNQAGIGKGSLRQQDFKYKIKQILKVLSVPVQLIACTNGEGLCRKPMTGMWDYFEKNCNENIKILKSKSFYVGDAAGRPAGPRLKRKDHSWADRCFALNLGLPFLTPQEHFLKQPIIEWNKPSFDPTTYSCTDLYIPSTVTLPLGELEVIILTGMPGSGKSYYCKTYLEPLNYVVINRDTLKSTEKCLALCEKSLQAGNNCAIDNTNVDVASRKAYISIARKYKAKCRSFVMNLSFDHLRHNIRFRQMTDKSHVKINEMVLNSMRKKYVMPELNEGFSEIIKVNFIPQFKNKEQLKLYKMYLLEK